MGKRGRYRHISKRLTYQRVLLAVHWLSQDGLYTHATNAEIARAAGRYVGTVESYLSDLEAEGTIAVFGHRNGLRRRIIVIRDHPEAEMFVGSLGMSNRLTRWEWMLSDAKKWNSR